MHFQLQIYSLIMAKYWNIIRLYNNNIIDPIQSLSLYNVMWSNYVYSSTNHILTKLALVLKPLSCDMQDHVNCSMHSII